MVEYRPLHTGNAGREGRNNMRGAKGSFPNCRRVENML